MKSSQLNVIKPNETIQSYFGVAFFLNLCWNYIQNERFKNTCRSD